MAARVAVFGERYSSNFGDSVILISSAYLVKQVLPDARVSIHDLSGRSSFTHSPRGQESIQSLKRRSVLMQPIVTRRSLMQLVSLARWMLPAGKQIRRYYSRAAREADLIVLGGGQILMDNALHYPLRLAYLSRLAQRDGKRILIHACGVEPHRSRLGTLLMRRALLSPAVVSVSCRDNYQSLCGLLPEYTGSEQMFVAYDSAIMAAEAFGARRNERSDVIGLGVVSPFSYAAVAARSGRGLSRDPEKILTEYWMALISILQDEGYRIRVFATTGAYDYVFACHLADALGWKDAERSRMLAPRPQTAECLVSEIAGFKAIIAHRLHANIIAYSLGTPSVGLAYDNKVADFGEISGRSRFFTSMDKSSPVDTVSLLCEAISNGIDFQQVDQLKSMTLAAWRRSILNAGYATY